MATFELIRTPDFPYSGFYFPEIAARLRKMGRVYAPEITNEDPREPFIQLERSFALVGHYNNVLLDMVANEIFMQTCRLPESLKYHLGLINFRMLPASPAEVDVLCTMARTYSTPVRVLEEARKFATENTSDTPEIIFENLDVVDITNRSDRLAYAYGVTLEKSGTCKTFSLEPDIIEVTAGDIFATADLNKVVEIQGSVVGNNVEDARIIELLDEVTPGSGTWNQARLSDASFVSEVGLSFKMREITSNGAAGLNAGTGFDPFASPPEAGDKFYFGHSEVMWDRYDLVTASVVGTVGAVWEFYDEDDIVMLPDDVVLNPSPGIMRFDLSSLLGVEEATGAHIKVKYIPTGYTVNGISSFVTSTNVVDIASYFGQTSPSINETDYQVYCYWRPISVISDTTLVGGRPMSQSGRVTFDIPQNSSDNWSKYGIYDKDDGELKTGYFIRYRVINNPGSAAGTALTSMNIANGTQYMVFTLTQGRTVEDSPLGSSSGDQNQEFTLFQKPYIHNSIHVYVDEGSGPIEWTAVNNLLTSTTIDRHFVPEAQTDGTVIVKFGDGVHGRIPPIGINNIVAVYRIGGNDDGNIGIGTLTVNRDGLGAFREVTNPRAGRFWVEADWASVESFEKVKKEVPLRLQTMYRAVTAGDCEVLARNYSNVNGVRPVARARAYEEAYGPKTVEIVVCGQGGAALPQTSRTELDQYFNGGGVYRGVLLLNYEATITNYEPRMIGVQVVVTANEVVTEALVVQTLSFLLTPTAVEQDGSTYVWQFGQEVPLSRISAEIFKISPGNVFKVAFSSPGDDITLSARELPMFDPTTTSVVIIPPTY